MIGAMQDDDLLDFLAVNKDVVAEILNGEEDDGDGQDKNECGLSEL